MVFNMGGCTLPSKPDIQYTKGSGWSLFNSTTMISHDKYHYSFDPEACQECLGGCCRGSDGYVWLTMDEMVEIAEAKGIDLESFSNSYLRLVLGRLALQQRRINGEYLCCFFDPFQRKCTIYPERPEQCRTYPFWEQFRDDPRELLQECPGIRISLSSDGKRADVACCLGTQSDRDHSTSQ